MEYVEAQISKKSAKTEEQKLKEMIDQEIESTVREQYGPNFRKPKGKELYQMIKVGKPPKVDRKPSSSFRTQRAKTVIYDDPRVYWPKYEPCEKKPREFKFTKPRTYEGQMRLIDRAEQNKKICYKVIKSINTIPVKQKPSMVSERKQRELQRQQSQSSSEKSEKPEPGPLKMMYTLKLRFQQMLEDEGEEMAQQSKKTEEQIRMEKIREQLIR
jgi:hypothetical protein